MRAITEEREFSLYRYLERQIDERSARFAVPVKLTSAAGLKPAVEPASAADLASAVKFALIVEFGLTVGLVLAVESVTAVAFAMTVDFVFAVGFAMTVKFVAVLSLSHLQTLSYLWSPCQLSVRCGVADERSYLRKW
jgi:hypothetical protein